ncbi:MAG: sulfate ABC transporter permease [Planctomycetes bacterium]|nr:sulfate ABC transporter permease [Planctomycetota bacterium]
MKWGLTATATGVIAVLVLIPVINVFAEALSGGIGVYWRNLFADPETRHSIYLTLTVAPIAVVANIIFAIAASWAIVHFEFPGRTLLTALIDLPFSVSPVVAGLMFVLIFGLQGYLGKFLRRDGYSIMPYIMAGIAAVAVIAIHSIMQHRQLPSANRKSHSCVIVVLSGVATFAAVLIIQLYFHIWPEHQSLKIIFATPGLVLATMFVTFPFVARELIPVMEAIGPEEELAALSLGASGWQTFWRVTIPNIKWGLIYGVILCNARAVGEFGAVYVVSGHIEGKTDTMPLRIEKLFQEYNLPGSFAVASALTLLALLTLAAKTLVERKAHAIHTRGAHTRGGIR